MSGKTYPASINKYMAKAYDRINVIVTKGDRDIYKALADSNGMSLNAYIVHLLEAEQSKQKPPTD